MALNILGDRWSLLIVREALYGATRFGEFQRNTGISKNLLTERLKQLIEDGILQQVAFADRGTSHVYELTEKGKALQTVMVALQQWSDVHVCGEGNEPVMLIDPATDTPVAALQLRNSAGQTVSFDDLVFKPGPGADGRTRKRLAAIE
jgi:DNA-binding HxlR family transcriptional regulator